MITVISKEYATEKSFSWFPSPRTLSSSKYILNEDSFRSKLRGLKVMSNSPIHGFSDTSLPLGS
ncbi:hypothetical protein TOREUM_31047 [Tenacibaculum litoreum]